MPFKNDSQRKSCFATNGWGGKVDCKAYAKDKPAAKKPAKSAAKKKGK